MSRTYSDARKLAHRNAETKRRAITDRRKQGRHDKALARMAGEVR